MLKTIFIASLVTISFAIPTNAEATTLYGYVCRTGDSIQGGIVRDIHLDSAAAECSNLGGELIVRRILDQ